MKRKQTAFGQIRLKFSLPQRCLRDQTVVTLEKPLQRNSGINELVNLHKRPVGSVRKDISGWTSPLLLFNLLQAHHNYYRREILEEKRGSLSRGLCRN